MPSISLNTAAAVCGLTKRTLWRYISDGRLSTLHEDEGAGGGRKPAWSLPTRWL